METCGNIATLLELALRGIAEGNLGEEPWQANYDKIRAVAKEALTRLKGVLTPLNNKGTTMTGKTEGVNAVNLMLEATALWSG